MNKVFNHIKYNWKEDLEGAIYVILIIGAIALAFSTLDRIDQHKETATVISVQALDEQVVTFETADGNTWEYTFDYDREIKPQDKAELTFKEYENADVTDDKIVNVKWVE